MPATQTDILEKAERLASNLAGGVANFSKNALLSIVADFMSTPRPDRDRLRRLLQLIPEESGGHTKRGDGYGAQVRLAAQEVSEVLQDGLTDEELKSLFGWTARLLLVRRENRSEPPRDPRRELRRPYSPEPVRRQPLPPSAPPRATAATTKEWTDVEIGWQNGSPAAFRGKDVATCPPGDLPAELLKMLKTLKKKTRLLGTVEVKKVLGKDLRIVKASSWRLVDK